MMKKIILPLIVSLLTLSSCSEANSETTQKVESDLIISEFVKGSGAYDRAIELYNISENDIDLSSYVLKIFKGSSVDKTIDIKLNGSLKAHKTYVLVHPSAKIELIEKADKIEENLMIDGSWPVAIYYKNAIVDVIGTIGYQADYAKYVDLVRKKEYLTPSDTFDNYQWVKYDLEETSLLGQVDDVISEEELLQGPILTKEVLNLEFIKSNSNGGGGVSNAELKGLMDGDTTRFAFNSEDGYKTNSVRYTGINTPEIQHGNKIQAQPWGYAAKDYNNKILKNAKHYLIQTTLDGPVRETYDRFLGFVWYTNVENPEIEDYRLLNFEMVREAYAFQAWHNTRNLKMFSSNVPYESFFDNAEKKVIKEQKRIHGEKDPNFNY